MCSLTIIPILLLSFFKDPITTGKQEAIKNLGSNQNIVIQRPDRDGGLLNLISRDYDDKLQVTISKPSMFSMCDKNQAENVRMKISRTREPSKMS